MAVAGAAGVTTKGVDSTAEAEEALELGKRLAREAGCIVAISGATDLVSSAAKPAFDANLRSQAQPIL
jgi:hydroxyethylthiazole kinase